MLLGLSQLIGLSGAAFGFHAGSVTPWETHLGSEEYPMDAKSFEGYLMLIWVAGIVHTSDIMV